MSDFEVMPAGTSKVLRRALQELEQRFADRAQSDPDAPERRCGGPGCDGTCCQRVQEPVAWRFRTAGIEHSAWRLTDDAGLVEQMRKLGHWDIRPLGELADEGGGK